MIRPKRIKRAYIPEFQRREEDRPYERVRSIPEYHTSRWTRESKAFRMANPVCAMCEAEGILTPSEVTDHIIPVAVCDDFWDRDNWQALCRKCNHLKGQTDKKIIRNYERRKMDGREG